MTTLSTLDCDFDRIFSEPVELNTHPRKVVRDALIEHCERLGFCDEQIQAVIAAAEHKRAGRPYTADAIAAGRAKAREIADKMRAIRTRFGTRDDGPKDAA